jgi:aryl-alcohol dehydrogenase-like predicted oxidoreductase
VLEGLEIGYRFIDTAFIYENEFEIGKALKIAFGANKIKREDLFICSKVSTLTAVRSVRSGMHRLFFSSTFLTSPFSLSFFSRSHSPILSSPLFLFLR